LTTSTLTRLAPTQVELHVPISADDLSAAEDRAFRKLAKNVRLPGFRPGKVPRKVFEQNYGTDRIASQALEDVVPELFAKAVREHDLHPVDRPKMELLPDDAGKPSGFKAVVDVRPEIDLKSYKGIEVKAPDETISDDDVESSLQQIARERATLVPVERAAKIGDVVTIDFEGTIDGTPFEGGTAKGQFAELEENRFIPGFASGIAGMNAGESRNVEAIFPDDYSETHLAGKTANFAVTLYDVKELEAPTLDDEFAKTVTGLETMDALRADIRTRLEAIAKGRARREMGNAIMESLLGAYDFELPQSMVDGEVEQMVRDAMGDAARREMTFPQYLESVGKTEEQLRENLTQSARARVKGTLLLEAIAKAENVTATPADVSAEMESLARQYRQPVDSIRKALGGNVLSLVDGIVRSKTIEFLIDNAAPK
jgi:trigger factor